MAGTSGDSTERVSGILFCLIHNSFTTQGLPKNGPNRAHPGVLTGPMKGCPAPAAETINAASALMAFLEQTMAYALFCHDAKLSKAYPTEADVWKQARMSGLVVDAISEEDKPSPRPLLDNDYEIRPCRPDPQEDPAKNKADAERDAELEPHWGS